METKIYKIWLLLLLLFCNLAVYGQQQADSLTHYLNLSAKNNPAVLQKLDEYRAAMQKVPQAGSLSDPELNVGVFLSPMELIGGNQVADIQLMQMFPWFGVLKNAKDEMSLMAKARYESFREAKLQVFYEVRRTWYELQKVQQDIVISEKNMELLRTIERLARMKYKAGSTGGGTSSASGTGRLTASGTTAGSSGMQSMGGNAAGNSGTTPVKASSSMQSSSMGSSPGDSGLAGLYRIQIETGDLENNIALLKNQQETLIARFNSYLNRPATSPVSISGVLRPETLGLSLSALPDSMLTDNPMLGMLKYEQQSLDARGKMVSRMGYPMVGVGVDYSLINKNPMSASSMNGKDMIMPMVKVTLPVYRKKYKAMQAEASLLKSATRQEFQAAANNLQAEYYEARQLFEDAGRRMKLYENQGQLTQKSLDIMIKTFSVSVAGLTEVLQLRQQMLGYEFRQVEAVADYNTSVAWLNKLMAKSQVQ